MEQWLGHCAVNHQVAGLNAAHTCVCEICFPVVIPPGHISPDFTSSKVKQFNSTQPWYTTLPLIVHMFGMMFLLKLRH